LRATIDHLEKTAPDIFLTTVSYPIKGTTYYDQLGDRVESPRAWHERSDRDLVVRGRPPRRYYDFARRWISGEVARQQHAAQGRPVLAARAAASAMIGRIGMRVTKATT
jgi:anaerobic magnesium-protoporphyrin IX monomethyl ester cyclase